MALRTLAQTVVIISLASSLGALQAAQSPPSRMAAETLVTLLDQRKLDTIAAQDPQDSSRFIAALYFGPGSQLLVVSARHPSTAGLQYRLMMHQYRDVYLDLQGTPISDGKFFVQDSGANGLGAAADSSDVDVVYENGTHQMTFGGAAQHQSPENGADARRAADAQYTHMLRVLAQSLVQENDQATPPDRSISAIAGTTRSYVF